MVTSRRAEEVAGSEPVPDIDGRIERGERRVVSFDLESGTLPVDGRLGDGQRSPIVPLG
jgi:hypothetical protein